MELDLDTLIERVQSTHSKYLEEREKFKSELNAVNLDKEKISNELINANTEIESLAKELKVVQEDLESTKQELSEKTSLMETMTSKEEVDKILVNDANIYKELQNKYETAKEKHTTEVEQLNKTIEELTKNADNFEIYSKSLKDEIQEKTTALANLENKFNDLETQKNDLNTAFLELKEKHNKTVENDANTDVKVTELNTTLENKSKEAEENLQKYLDLKEKTYKTIKHLVEDVIERQEGEIASLKETLANTVSKESLQEAQNNIATLNNKVNTLTQDNITKDNRIVDLTQQISQLTEEIKNLTPVRKTHSHLQDYIDSTIPVPEGTAAAEVMATRPTKVKEENLRITPLGKVSEDVINNTIRMLDGLYEGKYVNTDGNYPLNNALQVAENIGLPISTGNIIMERLCSMIKNGKPVMFYEGNIYYATIDKEDLKNYILR
jgi:chromosome segregation ATPase